MHRYDGTPDAPWPPAPAGWAIVDCDDELARARAAELAESVAIVAAGGELGAPGDDLPLWHYRDEWTASGMYRYYHFEHPAGSAIGALRYVGVDDPGGALGAVWDNNVVTNLSPDGAGGLSDGSTTYSPGQGNEPIPQPDAHCSEWIPDATDANVVAIANAISYQHASAPVKWVDQTVYTTNINGTSWRFVMWLSNGMHMVSTFRCVPATPVNPPAPSGGGSSAGGILLAIALAVVGVGGAVVATRARKGKSAQA